MDEEGGADVDSLNKYFYANIQFREIRELYKNGSSQRKLKEKFNISQSQVSGIVTYKFWRHVI